MAKALFSCPNCGRAVTKHVRHFEKIAFFGAVMNFNCDFCNEELVTGNTSEGMVVISQYQIDQREKKQRMERFDPCI